MKKVILLFFLGILFGTMCFAQNQQTAPPQVFVLGEHETEMNALSLQYETLLLDVCNSDMDAAFSKWLSMLREMEAHAESIEYDLNGIKLWLQVFWAKDGMIDHLAFHLKPDSRNVPSDELRTFFEGFVDGYRLPIMAEGVFSHYGAANFPTSAVVFRE